MARDLRALVEQLQRGPCNLSVLREVVDATIAKQRQFTSTPIPNGYASKIVAGLWVHLQRELGSALAGQAASSPVSERVSMSSDEIGWVIERDMYGRLHYRTGRPDSLGPYQWSVKHEDARRFARREDANCMLSWHCSDNGRVVEHLWCSTRGRVRSSTWTQKPESPVAVPVG